MVFQKSVLDSKTINPKHTPNITSASKWLKLTWILTCLLRCSLKANKNAVVQENSSKELKLILWMLINDLNLY